MRGETLREQVRSTVEPGARLYTDEWVGYRGLDDYERFVINHAVSYVEGHVHTNGIENFWSLLKRTIKGTYVSVEPFHLGRSSMSRRSGSMSANTTMVSGSARWHRPSLAGG